MKDRPLRCLSLKGFLYRTQQRFSTTEAGTENSLSALASLLGRRDVTEDRWEEEREPNKQPGRKYGEGGPWRGSLGPAT